MNIFHIEYQSPVSMKYEEASYHKYMYFRIHLIDKLLENNISLWVIESDAVWFDDPRKELTFPLQYDMVTIRDGFKHGYPAPGFLLLHTTLKVFIYVCYCILSVVTDHTYM